MEPLTLHGFTVLYEDEQGETQVAVRGSSIEGLPRAFYKYREHAEMLAMDIAGTARVVPARAVFTVLDEAE